MTNSALVIGGGTMGIGIVEVLLDSGASVVLVEPDDAAADRVRGRLANRSGLTVTDAVVDPLDIDLVIEAVPENLTLKQRILTAVEGSVPDGCLIASNTSSLSINAVAGSLHHPERFIGMHFFNPVPKSLLVELVVGTKTSSETVERAAGWLKQLRKEHITVRDSPGFATSRLGIAIGMEAIRMVEEGVASAEDIDRGMMLGYRFPMGPLRLTDLVGLDVRLAIAEHLAEELGPRFTPPDLLRRMVADGALGKKAGRGFYQWSTERR
jgi:3-hydroxybutyryl-CoA dehydrogenase